MKLDSKIYISGHRGLVGSAILRRLQRAGFTNLLTRTSAELDLRDQRDVEDFFAAEKPEYVFLAAAKVGGILANNTYRAQFIYENQQIQNNVIHSAYLSGVKKLLFLGSSCIYPKMAPQPIKEEYLLTGPLEPTNEPYAIAKIAGIKMCQAYRAQYGCDFIAVMPTNLYGPNDNFELETSHVLPALLRKFHLGKCLEENDFAALREDLNRRPIEGVDGQAEENRILEILGKYGIGYEEEGNKGIGYKGIGDKGIGERKVVVTLWGTGQPRREFLHVDDLADACLYLMQNYSQEEFVNIGVGADLPIAELAEMVRRIVGFSGEIRYDREKPDGTPRKLLDVSRLHSLRWREKLALPEGIRQVYDWYVGQ